MRERPTVRVLLFDPADRLLLMKARLPSTPQGAGAWFALGGGVEPGESLEIAALREVAEESGITDIELGPAIWRRDVALDLGEGGMTLLKETYFVARCEAAEPSRAGWEPGELSFCDDIRWWRIEELPHLDGPLYPERLLELLPQVLAGNYPADPIEISL